jgi:hypothetical protein
VTRALPGGIYRLTIGEETIYGFATTLPPRHCRDVLEGLPDTGHVVRLHHGLGDHDGHRSPQTLR